MTPTTLVTGAAGFIGMHVCERLLAQGHRVVGLDNLNDYYDPELKRARLAQLEPRDGFEFVRLDLADNPAVDAVFRDRRPEFVVHLAAQAGVRYALDHPFSYVDSNLRGTASVLEGCRHHRVRHLVCASSSSVYGGNAKVPFSERDPVDHPVSLYAATKRSNELMAHSYAHLFGLPVTMLRYFTVYGPWGRPDMAIWKFSDGLLSSKPIDVFAGGHLSRDFTHVDDVVEAYVRLLDPDVAADVYNVASGVGTPLRDLLDTLLGLADQHPLIECDPERVRPADYLVGDASRLRAATGWAPRVPIERMLERLLEDWRRKISAS